MVHSLIKSNIHPYNDFCSNSILKSKQAEAFSCENRKILFRCPVSCLLRIS